MNPPHPLLQRGLALWNGVTHALDLAQPAAALAARLYLAQAFFLSGLTKVRDWETTLLLFTEEYRPSSPPSRARRANWCCPCCCCSAWPGASRRWACRW